MRLKHGKNYKQEIEVDEGPVRHEAERDIQKNENKL